MTRVDVASLLRVKAFSRLDFQVGPVIVPNDLRSPIAALLIEQPGDKTLKDNTDLFIHRGQMQSLCPACAAAALYTLQAFAPSGGKGHRTSMRGGGPLSTLLKGRNLWESVWLNVLPSGPRPDEMAAQ